MKYLETKLIKTQIKSSCVSKIEYLREVTERNAIQSAMKVFTISGKPSGFCADISIRFENSTLHLTFRKLAFP